MPYCATTEEVEKLKDTGFGDATVVAAVAAELLRARKKLAEVVIDIGLRGTRDG